MDETFSSLFAVNNLAGHVSYVLIAISYGLSNIFWLRVTACIGLLFEILYFWLTSEAMFTGIAWDIVFITINAWQLSRLLHDRFSVRLTHGDSTVLRQAFHRLDKAQIGRLLKAGSWRDLAPGEVLTRRGETVPELYFLCAGTLDVHLGDRAIARLCAGSFVGEVAFLTDQVASATVIAAEPARIIAFAKDKLTALCLRDEQVGLTLFRLIGDDLARKMVATSERAATSAQAWPYPAQ
ncbi:MAG: cyclic nucleotide-binding domain-containing protein [Hyphomicrobiales bacterium]